LRNTTGQVVILGASMAAHAFVNFNKHTGLVVRVRRKDFGFSGGNSDITFDESGHDTSSSLNTGGKGGDVEDEKVLSLLRGVTGKDRSLDSSTIGNSLIRVDVLVRFLVVEEVGNEFDDKRDTSGTTDQDDLMDV
jgi:hypothetical protein